MACNSKTANHRAKDNEIWVSVVVGDIVYSFDLVALKVIWGLFGALVSKWRVARNRLTIEIISDSGILVEHTRDTFDLVVFKVILPPEVENRLIIHGFNRIIDFDRLRNFTCMLKTHSFEEPYMNGIYFRLNCTNRLRCVY